MRRKTRRKISSPQPEPLGISPEKLAKKIKPVRSHNQYIKGLLYGRSGTGKTTMAATIVDLCEGERDRALLLDLREKGTDSVADVDRLDVIEIDNWNTFEGLYWYLKDEDHKYGAMIVDTATRLQGAAMAMARERSNLEAADVMDRLAWNQLGGMLGPRLLDLRDLPMHVIFICQDRRLETDEDMMNESDLLPEIGPALMPSIAKEVCAMTSVIGNTFIRQKTIQTKGGKSKKKTDFCLRLGPHPLYLTKLRVPKHVVVPSVIVDPSFRKIQDIVNEGKKNG